jgi:hypothetical protein
MAEFVRVKNRVHGGVASLPKAALTSFPDWEPVEGPAPSRPKPKRDLKSQSNAAPAASTETE